MFAAKQTESVKTCKDYAIHKEITTILKMGANNIILKLCDLCEYFASTLIMEETKKIER